MCYVCYFFSRVCLIRGNRKQKQFLHRSSTLATSPPSHPHISKRGEGQEQEKRLHKLQCHIQSRQACANPWCGASWSALPAPPLPSHTFLSISAQPLTLLWPYRDKGGGLLHLISKTCHRSYLPTQPGGHLSCLPLLVFVFPSSSSYSSLECKIFGSLWACHTLFERCFSLCSIKSSQSN